MPRDAGAASIAVSVPADDYLVLAASEMLAEAGFSGMAQLDFIHCDGSHFLIDVNPRYYSSIRLALACRVNLPAIWHAIVVDEPVPRCHYRTGVGFRWLEADIRAAIHGTPQVLAERTRGGRGSHVGVGRPGSWAAALHPSDAWTVAKAIPRRGTNVSQPNGPPPHRSRE
jgi:predicted ATP-grasp superfamily ATP-dependent carboligase